jgi:hypothetical protein
MKKQQLSPKLEPKLQRGHERVPRKVSQQKIEKIKSKIGDFKGSLTSD